VVSGRKHTEEGSVAAEHVKVDANTEITYGVSMGLDKMNEEEG
jgi:hypothetical protein